MADRRTQVTFAELMHRGILEIGDGYRAKNSELGGDGPIFMRAGRLTQSGWDWDGAECFHAELAAKVTPKMAKPRDTVITTKGNSTGRTGYVPDGAPQFVYSPHLSYWRSMNSDELDARYLRYWALSSEFRSQLKAMAHGTDMAPYLSLSDQRRIQIALPVIERQRGIAEVLGALDDKIAANERITAAALELADTHYARTARELDFGSETFGSVATVVGGGTPSTKTEEYWGGGIAWTTPTDVTALSAPYLFETSRTITSAGLDNCASQLYPAQSIFMTSRATIGVFALPQVPAAVNQGFIVVLPPTEELRWWLLHEMRSRVGEMISLANGSTFLELSRKNFKAMPIRLADAQVVAEFAQAVSPLHGRAARAAAESRSLAALRDTLLPQLMSGKLRIRDAEKIVEEAA
ncbi:restriction endonuclease subunit S [Streptomyces argyrophyllae]|uniref:Restriction endonuclease subunit S n=2 Tax=Streptomyces argyrophylli TaxID=2726118 RepID=A0A6M4PJP8_9ACTN|nr:restriction endonuclease subunit S [Streptomyces argyrophyllae]